jgi:circadian clock protein KaiC
LDSVSSFESAGTKRDSIAMMMRLIDQLKAHQISTMLTSLTPAGENGDGYAIGVSSLIDGWILLRNLELAGERTRTLHVLKARGIRHSNQVRELLITNQGLDLKSIDAGAYGILPGSGEFTRRLRGRLSASNESTVRQQEMVARKRSGPRRVAPIQGLNPRPRKSARTAR